MQDAKYQLREADRTDAKETMLRNNWFPSGDCMDIGANQLRFTSALLADGADTVFAYDLATPDHIPTGVVFKKCDFSKERPLPRVDTTLCLSVLHHILGKYGWPACFDVWRQILEASKVVYFEIGMPSEEGDFYWKDKILGRVSLDNDYLSMFLQDPLVRRFSKVGELPMHGSVRPIYRVVTK